MKRLTIAICFMCCLVPAVYAEKSNEDVKIAALNVRAFGHSKVNKPQVIEHLITMVSSYDLIFLQEIRGKPNEVVQAFLKRLNQKTQGRYRAVTSPPLGRNSYREQYAYIYDSGTIDIKETWVYDDYDDTFDREPFVAEITTPHHSFMTIGIHTSPINARKEIKALNLVERSVVAKSKNENVIVLGDLNADCAYYSEKASSLQVFARTARVWIEDHHDTTVSPSDCAYDRIISLGPITESLSSPVIFKFDAEFSLSTEQALDVSDHYPVSITLSSPKEKLSCGKNPYLTVENYCYATMGSRKTRMPDHCCLP